MTPAARYQAVIEIFDKAAAQNCGIQVSFLRWQRHSRFAGSKDRTAIQDCIYDILRNLSACIALGGGRDGRGLVLGILRLNKKTIDAIDAIFSGEKYTPFPLSDEEKTYAPVLNIDEKLGCPKWLWPEIKDEYGAQAEELMRAFLRRGDIFLRANSTRITAKKLCDALAQDGILAEPTKKAPHGIKIYGHPCKLRDNKLFEQGFFEFQDIHSQAAIFDLELEQGKEKKKILDYCAGGGGKALALAQRFNQIIYAHDAYPKRMQDLKARATRAGYDIRKIDIFYIKKIMPFDVVLCDVPCSGSGAWRRDPETKWRLNAKNLDDLCIKQAEILAKACQFVHPKGALIYMTCSILSRENTAQIDAFLKKNSDWRLKKDCIYSPLDQGDGFYVAHLIRV